MCAGYPKVVCLQEAGDLATSTSALPAAIAERYMVLSARRETVLLLRSDCIKEAVALPDDKWRAQLQASGEQLAWDLKADWESNMDKVSSGLV